MAEGDRQRELAEGDRFAGYTIERRLGRGGMGMVYLALEERLERRVALKLITPEAASEEVFLQRFAHESKIAASIEHPNVVPIYAAGEEGGIPYIAMRYVSGSDLGRRVAGGNRLDPAHAAALIAQVANGLDAIHAAGLVHRDVKPANVLLSGPEGSEHAYITDFGVARNVAATTGLTKTGRFVGTLDYVAPEQIAGTGVDARADVYALGCLLFKLLTSEVPFPKEDEAARLYAHLNEPPPAPSLVVPRVPMALDDVVDRAMSKAPGDRYPSAGDLGRATLAAVSGEDVAIPERTVATGDAATSQPDATPPTGAIPPTRTAAAPTAPTIPEQPPEAVRRRRRPLLLVLGALAVAVVVGAIALAGGGGGGDGGGGEKATLSSAQLIKRADAICAESQQAFLETTTNIPTGETTPSVVYAKILSGISNRAVRQFRKLEPPPEVSTDYREYVEAQERVRQWDQDALAAARVGDTNAYLAARAKRNDEQPLRQRLAHDIGLQVCSNAPD